MDAFVTGGGGFLGRAIIRQALDRGWKVRSYSRGSYPDLEALGVAHTRGDVADGASLSRAVKGCDVVFHAAAKPGIWGRYEDYYEANVRGTENVLAACLEQEVRKLVYTSSPSAVFSGRDQQGINESVPYPKRFLCHYAATKALSERQVLDANGPALATVALRPRLIWGAGDPNVLPRLLKLAHAGRLRFVDHGRHLIDHTYVDNAAQAHILAAERLNEGAAVGGKAYFISNGEPLPAGELVNRLLEACGMPSVAASVPRAVALGIAWANELLWKSMGYDGDPPTTRYLVLSMGADNWFDISAAQRELGYSPSVTSAEGFRRLAAWHGRQPR
jgi:2-alkyl-3-oxoalkanoate reductase